MMIGISFVVWRYGDGIFSNVSMELPKFSMVSRELGNTVNALAIDGIFFRTAVTAIFVRRWRYYFPICSFSHVFMAMFCKSDGIIENTGTVNKYCREYQGNSSTGHETPRYCGRPLPPPRLAFIILLKVIPVPVGQPIPQSPARQHCTGGPRA